MPSFFSSQNGDVSLPLNTLQIQGTQYDVLNKLRTVFARAKASNPETDPNMTTPPTLTAAASDTSGLAKFYTADKFPSIMALTGGNFCYSGSNNRGAMWNQNVAGDAGNVNFVAAPQIPPLPTGAGGIGANAVGPWSPKFMTDAPVFQLRGAATVTGNPLRWIIDRQYIDRTGNDLFTNNYLKFDFGGVRKNRLVEIEGQYAVNWFSLQVDAQSRVWQPQPIDPVTGIIWGDSHTEGLSGIPNAAWSGCSAIAGRLLGIWDWNIASIGGTGYYKTGTTGLRKSIRGQMDDYLSIANPRKFDLIVFAGGYNDIGFNAPAVVAEAMACWKKARALQPRAYIVVFGIWGAKQGPGATIIALENALKAQFDLWNDPFSAFVRVSTAFEPWEFGSDGSGNDGIYVSGDLVHDNSAGQNYRGYRMADAIRQAVFAEAA